MEVNVGWYFLAMILPFVVALAYAIISWLLDRAKYEPGEREIRAEPLVEPEDDPYLRFESYNHYEDGDYR